ncbi:MAG TPA: hypothetical protein VLI90_00425, partial [Tepidisphaeraceae bacterium]|nr:hypothetical protein [Tepidisphaeraceae bacterium]
EMNAALEAAMAGFIGVNVTNDPDESRAGMAAITPLAGGALPGDRPKTAADEEVEVKEFGGEFYPVVRSVHKEHKNEEEAATAAVVEPPPPSPPAKKK